MKKLEQVRITSIFDIVGQAKMLKHDAYPCKLIRYRCSCGAYYEVLRKYNRRSASLTGYAYGENNTICPTCGRQSHLNKDLQYDTAPYSAIISLYELRKEVILKFKYDIPLWNKKYAPKGTFCEELRFNIKERKTTFTQNHKKHFIGIPLDIFLLENSLMRFLSCRSNTIKNFSALVHLLKTTRKTVSKKFKELHGYELKSVYTSHDTYTGKLAFPLFNIAYRLIFTDSPNLKPNKVPREILRDMLFLKGCDTRMLKHIDTKNPYPWLMQNYRIAQKPFYKKLLIENPMYFKLLAEACKLPWNLDYQQQLISLLINSYEVKCGIVSPREHRFLGYTYTEKLFGALHLLARYQPKDILHLMQSKDYDYIIDIVRMLKDLPYKYRLISRGVRIKDLHDWAVEIKYRIKHSNYSLGVSAQLVNRFSNPVKDMQFVVPCTSYELRDIGKKLKNCVYTYAERCRKGECLIVVAMQGNQYIACLEIRNSTLNQAKLLANEAVSSDSNVNNIIVDWCKLTHIGIGTADVAV